MKTVSANLQSHIEQEVTTLTTIWKIVRQDATEFYFTTSDQNLTFEGNLYESQTGFSATAIEHDNNLGVNNLNVLGFLNSAQISEEDLRAGLFDYANVFVSYVNYESLTDGNIKMQRGVLGEVMINDNDTFSVELRGMSQFFSGVIGEKYLPECNVDLGSTRCGFDIGPITVSDTILTVTDRTTFTLTTATNADDDFNLGGLTFTSGANINQTIEVLDWTLSSKQIVLYLPAGKDIQIGDTVDVYPGCDRVLDTCINKFDNVLNFQGFPHVPGERFMYSLARK